MTYDYFDYAFHLKKARELVAECLVKAKMQHLFVTVEFNNRFTSRMGDANSSAKYGTGTPYSGGRIRLSKPLWKRATPEERRQTVIHEAAHIIANCRYRQSCKHNNLWKGVMRELGVKPDRCHDVDRGDLTRKAKRFELKCPNCTKVYSITQHLRTRWLRNRQTRKCGVCRSSITANYVEANTW